MASPAGDPEAPSPVLDAMVGKGWAPLTYRGRPVGIGNAPGSTIYFLGPRTLYRILDPETGLIREPTEEEIEQFGGIPIAEQRARRSRVPPFSGPGQRDVYEATLISYGDLKVPRRQGTIEGLDRSTVPFWRSEVPKVEDPKLRDLVLADLAQMFRAADFEWKDDPETVMGLKFRDVNVQAKAQEVASKVKVVCPDHPDSVCQADYAPQTNSFKWACPRRGCDFSVVWGRDGGNGQVQMALVTLGRIKVLALEGATDQGIIPVCPLCRLELKLADDQATWRCRACPFTITDGYLERYKSGQKKPVAIGWIDWESRATPWQPFEESIAEINQAVQSRAITFDED